MSSDVRRLSHGVKSPETSCCNTSKPELSDVLEGRCPAPWTLSAFARFLEQNYCSETLHFTTDVVAYQKAFASKPARNDESAQHNLAVGLSARWQIILEKYIRPDAEEEINIPGSARDALLRHQDPLQPPPPSVLQPAYDMMIELMAGVFVQFVEKVRPCRYSVQLCVDDSDSSPTSPVAQPDLPLPFYRRAHEDWGKSRVYKSIQYYRRLSTKLPVVEVKTAERRESGSHRFLGKW